MSIDKYKQEAAAASFILRASCEAARGIVAAVTSVLFEQGCYLNEMAQFDDRESGRFFMRAHAQVQIGTSTLVDIREALRPVSERFGIDWSIHSTAQPVKVLIMVSKFDHCFDDLLYRHHKGELPMQITAVVSNHLDLRPMAEREGLRFIYLPVTKENKLEQEVRLMEIIEQTGTELVVLARYMQILSDSLCRELRGRAINIHHSFLPGFKGAKPYHQAYERGVKLIGATAHYVTADLDEGPIIEQAVQVVDHSYSPEALVAVGRDTETIALSRAVKLHVEHRVFLDGNKTVIFK
ncbi:formyltetrahydrofolate deformylase [Thiothrix eikelboomii]|uniref:Formyltetrahydrofolate deformylase n=1 Tax=Thiothrix eikelboomii TaxID=92487 RepID=A0A1T4W2Z4_9GAMM|nr:formyltetrahydrofolate deformylase [Thiothrix eikelboomii]SKA71081.1 formyltetrahydrofolate deformylase [Thiothrix eikelboomii]